MKPESVSNILLLKAGAASGQFIVENAYSYLKHKRLELFLKYECSDVIIIPKYVFRLMDEPTYVEISAVKLLAVNTHSPTTMPVSIRK